MKYIREINQNILNFQGLLDNFTIIILSYIKIKYFKYYLKLKFKH